MAMHVQPLYNTRSSASITHNGVTLFVHAPNGRKWATIARDVTFCEVICCFRRHSLPLIEFEADYPASEYPDLLALFGE